MKRREHEAAIKERAATHRAEIERITANWVADVDELQAVIEVYADALNTQDEEIARLRACLAQALNNQDGWATEARNLLGR